MYLGGCQPKSCWNFVAIGTLILFYSLQAETPNYSSTYWCYALTEWPNEIFVDGIVRLHFHNYLEQEWNMNTLLPRPKLNVETDYY